ncbi:MAG: PadR family transcriptional regulator [Frankiales bacterium]|nr:PadR family transcriptional regulator [Frankiales bacterium]
MQPVHGYDIRRELVSWQLEDHANLKPGSIYSAIRTLERDGCLAVHSRESDQSRPEKTSYVITGEGEKEFQILLRQTWWNVKPVSDPLLPALALMPFMPREELIAALTARTSQLTNAIASLAFARGSIQDGATGEDGQIPEHVRETFDLIMARDKAEIEWTKALIRRLRDGTYHFVGETGYDQVAFPIPVAD